MEVLAHFVSNANALKKSRGNMVGKYESTCSWRTIGVQSVGHRHSASRNNRGIKRTRRLRMPQADATRNFNAARFEGLLQRQCCHLARIAHCEIEFDGRMAGRN